jgi:hypothetical protein
MPEELLARSHAGAEYDAAARTDDHKTTTIAERRVHLVLARGCAAVQSASALKRIL